MNALTRTGGAILTAQDAARVQEAVDNSIAANTRGAYVRAAEAFAAWLGDRPATDETVAAYLAARFETGSAPASLRLYAAGIGAVARAQGYEDPRGELTRQTLKGLVRQGKGRGRGQAKPLRREDAVAAARLAAAGGTAAGLRDAALLLVASDTLLRASELRRLTWADIDQEADGTARVTLTHSKTDQEGRGDVRFLTSIAVDAIAAWRAAVVAAEAPETVAADSAIFRPTSRGGNVVAYGRSAGLELTAQAVGNIIKRRAAAIGVDGCSAHSTRVGSAVSLSARGASTTAIATAGGWRDMDTVGRYTRAQEAGRGAVARFFQDAGK